MNEKNNEKNKNKKIITKKKDEPTACTHFAAHSALRQFFKTFLPCLGTVSKKKLMEFSIKLAGWVLDDPVFH